MIVLCCGIHWDTRPQLHQITHCIDCGRNLLDTVKKRSRIYTELAPGGIFYRFKEYVGTEP